MPDRLPRIYLASASPRRRELLAQIGVAHQRLSVDVPERLLAGETPELFVLRLALALAKAEAGRAMLDDEPTPVLGADTVVVIDGKVLGKPRDREDGLAMLARLSGRKHQVVTAVALVDGENEASRLSVSNVSFRPIGAREREAYWASGEPLDKAGAYAVQGLAAVFIERIEGSYSGIMGLPLFETAELLAAFGIEVL